MTLTMRAMAIQKPPPNVVIRTGRAEDATALSGLVAELGFPATLQDVENRLAALMRAGETVLVAADGDRVVGFAAVHVTPVLHRPTPVGRITALVVTQACRGIGAGRALVAAAEQIARERGCGLIEVTSNRSLAAAHAFYDRLGYEATSLRFRKILA